MPLNIDQYVYRINKCLGIFMEMEMVFRSLGIFMEMEMVFISLGIFMEMEMVYLSEEFLFWGMGRAYSRRVNMLGDFSRIRS